MSESSPQHPAPPQPPPPPPTRETWTRIERRTSSPLATSSFLAEKSRLVSIQQQQLNSTAYSATDDGMAPKTKPQQHEQQQQQQQQQPMEYNNRQLEADAVPFNNDRSTNGGILGGTISRAILADDRGRVSERNEKMQQPSNDDDGEHHPPVLIPTSESSTTISTTAAATRTSLADKQRISLQLEEQQFSDSSNNNNNNNTADDGCMHDDATLTNKAVVVAPTESITSTTITHHPGAIHIPGWRRRAGGVRDHDEDEDDSESEEEEEEEESSATASTSQQDHFNILSAQLVDEDEMQRHAEMLFQQMLSQAAVAELVDEDELRQRSLEQATLELSRQQQQQQQLKQSNQAADGVADDAQQQQPDGKNKWQQQRRQQWLTLRIFAVFMLFIVVAVAIAAVVLAMGDDSLFGSRRRRQEQRSGALPLSSSSITPSVSFSPSTTPSAMPSAASSWHQIGNSISGVKSIERFGAELEFSANGNTVVAATFEHGHVRAYRYYHNETTSDEQWKQLGPDMIFETLYPEKICLSPNGKYLGILSLPTSTTTGGGISMVRVFALRENDGKNNNATANTNTEEDIDETAVTSAMVWEQIGSDIVHYPYHAWSSSLTDNLVLAVGYSNASISSTSSYQEGGIVYVYQFDSNQSDWVRMGQEIKMLAWSMELVQIGDGKTDGTLVLAVGGNRRARTFRYVPDIDLWSQFGSDLIGDDEAGDERSAFFGVMTSLSMDGETIVIGAGNDAYGHGIGRLRTFSYDAASDDWLSWGKDLKNPTLLFGQFSLSANGKVLVTTTQQTDVVLDKWAGVTGQIRTWDFIASHKIAAAAAAGETVDDAVGGGGEWIQRDAALVVGTLNSDFGYRIALSADGNRLATSAIYALNDQGIESGKVRVFEQY